MHADWVVLAQHRHREDASVARGLHAEPSARSSRDPRDVRDVDGRAIQDRAAGDDVATAAGSSPCSRSGGPPQLWRQPRVDQFAVEPEDRGVSASHSRAALCAIASKTGWTSVGELLMTRRISLGRRLLLQGLGELAVAGLHSVNSRTFSMAITAWSANVSRSAICVAVKGTASRRVDDDRADRLTVAQHRHRQHGAEARRDEGVHVVVGIGEHVRGEPYGPVEDRAARDDCRVRAAVGTRW